MASDSRSAGVGSRHDSDRGAACAVFVDRVIDAGRVWVIWRGAGLLRAQGVDGSVAQPFWSARNRVDRMIAQSSTSGLLEAREMALDEFVRRVLPDLADGGVLVGIDWEPPESGWVMHAFEIRDRMRQMIHVRIN